MRDGGDEGHETSAAEELGDEDSSVALGFGGVDPLQARAKNTGLAAALSENAATVATHGGEMEMVGRMEMRREMRRGGESNQRRRERGGIYKRREENF